MKKLLGLMVVSIIALAGCSSSDDGKIDLSEQKEIYVYESAAKPNYAKVEDDNLKLDLDWSFGTNEDSMKKMTFTESNISVTAYQNNEILVYDPAESSSIGNSIYEKNDGNVTLSFRLKDKTTPVDFKVFWGKLSGDEQPIAFTVDIAKK